MAILGIPREFTLAPLPAAGLSRVRAWFRAAGVLVAPPVKTILPTAFCRLDEVVYRFRSNWMAEEEEYAAIPTREESRPMLKNEMTLLINRKATPWFARPTLPDLSRRNTQSTFRSQAAV
jgi:hypothetical protein